MLKNVFRYFSLSDAERSKLAWQADLKKRKKQLMAMGFVSEYPLPELGNYYRNWINSWYCADCGCQGMTDVSMVNRLINVYIIFAVCDTCAAYEELPYDYSIN